MSLLNMKALLAVAWLFGTFVFLALALRVPSVSDGMVIAAVAILPPIILWFWWNDPSPTMSESIHEARNSPTIRRTPGNRR